MGTSPARVCTLQSASIAAATMCRGRHVCFLPLEGRGHSFPGSVHRCTVEWWQLRHTRTGPWSPNIGPTAAAWQQHGQPYQPFALSVSSRPPASDRQIIKRVIQANGFLRSPIAVHLCADLVLFKGSDKYLACFSIKPTF